RGHRAARPVVHRVGPYGAGHRARAEGDRGPAAVLREPRPVLLDGLRAGEGERAPGPRPLQEDAGGEPGLPRRGPAGRGHRVRQDAVAAAAVGGDGRGGRCRWGTGRGKSFAGPRGTAGGDDSTVIRGAEAGGRATRVTGCPRSARGAEAS